MRLILKIRNKICDEDLHPLALSGDQEIAVLWSNERDVSLFYGLCDGEGDEPP